MSVAVLTEAAARGEVGGDPARTGITVTAATILWLSVVVWLEAGEKEFFSSFS